MLEKFEHEEELDKSVEIVGSGTQINESNDVFLDLTPVEENNEIFKNKPVVECQPIITNA